MIEIDRLQKSFGKVRALKGITFQVPDGQITGLLGPNGAGKTTCLRILYTILRPDSGSARVDGHDSVADPEGVKRAIGALPADSRGLYPRLTSRENIRYYGRLHGLHGAALEGYIDELARLLDMGEIIDRRTVGFSTGQQLKVAIARALVHQPKTVLLDEPTTGLDVMSTRAMRTFVRRLRDEGKCVLFSSHIMQEVAALCERVVVVTQGQVVAEGTPQELRESTGEQDLEDAFVSAIGSAEGLG
ncbi:MAG: ATP-binding cassette domain-containing protein [Deltaproteobacteria bacterium]|nr:ATP-binding cassette domain-containing protein [Deltaproteobacteria bacterium]